MDTRSVIDGVAARSGIPRKAARRVAEETLRAIVIELERSGRVEVGGLGTFDVEYSGNRVTVNFRVARDVVRRLS